MFVYFSVFLKNPGITKSVQSGSVLISLCCYFSVWKLCKKSCFSCFYGIMACISKVEKWAENTILTEVFSILKLSVVQKVKLH